MKLTSDPNPAYYQIKSVDQAQITLYNKKTQALESYTSSLIVFPNKEPIVLTADKLGLTGFHGLSDLNADFFNALISNKTIDKQDIDILLIGTGEKHQTLMPHTYHPLITLGIGCEYMNSAAAARTFTVLCTEERNIAVLFVMSTII